uniref:Uncharacterized protein n=1 Tax=Panagrolaimus superbus TaxID=310955 RepID=A0A914Z792_9BILA
MATSTRNSVVSLISTAPSGMAQTGSNRHHHHHHHQVETKLLEDEGVVLPSSSSKDDDNLSESSDDIEIIARQTLDRIHEDLPKSYDSPRSKTKLSSSDVSNYASSEPSAKNGAKNSSTKNLSNNNIDIEAADNSNDNDKNDKTKKTTKQAKKDGYKKRTAWKMNEDEEQDRDEEGEK